MIIVRLIQKTMVNKFVPSGHGLDDRYFLSLARSCARSYTFTHYPAVGFARKHDDSMLRRGPI
jgi:hypothetical protein